MLYRPKTRKAERTSLLWRPILRSRDLNPTMGTGPDQVWLAGCDVEYWLPRFREEDEEEEGMRHGIRDMFAFCCVATLPLDAEEYWQEDLVAQLAEIRFMAIQPFRRMKVAAVIGPDKLVGEGDDSRLETCA